MKKLDSPENATIDHYIEVLEFHLKRNFENKEGEKLLQEFEEAKVQ